MFDVFISYAHSDKDVAHYIASGLEKWGFRVWWDDHLRSGDRYSQKIDEALENAKKVLVLWSQAAIKSAWVEAEATRAYKNRKLVQFRLEADCVPLPFDAMQCPKIERGNIDLSSLVAELQLGIEVRSASNIQPDQPRVSSDDERRQRDDDEAWEATKKLASIAAYVAYLKAWPAGSHAVIARRLMALRRSNRKVRIVPLPADDGFRIAVSPDGTLIASSGRDGRISIRNAVTGQLVQMLDDISRDIRDLAFTADGAFLLCSTADEGLVFVDVSDA